MRSALRTLIFGVCALLVVGCNDNKAEKARKHAAAERAHHDAAEQQIFADPERALVELKRRLRKTIKFKNSVILVDSPFGMGTLLGSATSFLNLYVIPPDTPWTVSCGLGMTVTFGNVISGDTGGVTNDVQVALTLASLDKTQCETLGPAVGKEIQAILAGK